jgi:hypothetical protein
MIWGTYHGVLLVLHRQWQELRKRLGFRWSGVFATGISWWLTFSAVCIGYIFFRSNSTRQAFAMLKAIASPQTYRHLTLDHSFYVMTFLAAAGYFAVIGGSALLDRLGEAARKETVPAILVLALYLSVIFQPGHAATGPVMYALF